MNKLILPIFISLFAYSCQSNAQQKDHSTTSSAEGEQVTIQHVDVAEFAALMEGEEVVLLDVRTPRETSVGMIEGALEIDVLEEDNFEQQIQQLDKDKTYLVYCKSGGRSTTACDKMAATGFTKLYNLKGGYTAWQKQ
jgi:rhodanese-related sulfurtransferase